MSISRNIGRSRKRHSYDPPVCCCGEWRRSIKITVPEFELKCTTAWPPRTKLFDLGECTTLQRVIASNDRSESKSRPALWHFRIKRNYKSTTCLSRCHLDGSFPLLFTINARSFRFFPRLTYTRTAMISAILSFHPLRVSATIVEQVSAFVEFEHSSMAFYHWTRGIDVYRRGDAQHIQRTFPEILTQQHFVEMSAQCASSRRLLFIPPDVEKFDFEPTRSKLLRIFNGESTAEKVRSYGSTLFRQFSDFFKDNRVSRYSRHVVLWLS